MSLAAPVACIRPLAAMGGGVDPSSSVGGFIPCGSRPMLLCPLGFLASFGGVSRAVRLAKYPVRIGPVLLPLGLTICA